MTYSLGAGETTQIVRDGQRGDRYLVEVTSGTARFETDVRYVHNGLRVPEDTQRIITLEEAGEDVYALADGEAATIEVRRLGFNVSLFGREIIRVENSPNQPDMNFFNRTNYPRIGSVNSDSYPITVDESWTIKELLAFDIPEDKELEITSESGDQTTIEPKRRGFVIDTVQIDSFTLSDPEGTGGEANLFYSGES